MRCREFMHRLLQNPWEHVTVPPTGAVQSASVLHWTHRPFWQNGPIEPAPPHWAFVQQLSPNRHVAEQQTPPAQVAPSDASATPHTPSWHVATLQSGGLGQLAGDAHWPHSPAAVQVVTPAGQQAP